MADDPTIGRDGKSYPLTPKQEAFVRAYKACGVASDAYEQVYGCKGWQRIAVNVAASKLLANPKVQAKLAEVGQEDRAKLALTADWFIERLIRRSDAADAIGKHADATAAENLATKLLGLQVDRVDQTVRQVEVAEQKPDLAPIRHAAAQQTPPAPQPEHDSETDNRVTH